jgi:proteic killer suppression protein
MWHVYEHRNLGKGLRGVPIEVLKRYQKWKDIVTTSGPSGLRFGIGSGEGD